MAEEVFDQVAYMERQNAAKAGKPGEVAAPVAVKPEEPPKSEEHDDEPHLNRRARRALEAKDRELAELRGRLAAIEEYGLKKPEVKPAVEADPEPKRADFASDAEFNRALGRWDSRQVANEVVSKKEQTAQEKAEVESLIAELNASEAKMLKDKEKFEDWKEAQEAMIELEEDDPSLKWDLLSPFDLMLKRSDVYADLLYHFFKNPDQLREILALKGAAQITRFHRLEGRVEKMYSKQQDQTSEVVQASLEKGKERTAHPAEGSTPGRNTSDGANRPKPRPSSEVSARGGSAPPEEPAIGSPAWMEARNRRQYGDHR